jgi:hypothetical protein
MERWRIMEIITVMIKIFQTMDEGEEWERGKGMCYYRFSLESKRI